MGAVLLTGFVGKGRGEGRHQLEKDAQSRGNFFFFFFGQSSVVCGISVRRPGKLGPWQ